MQVNFTRKSYKKGEVGNMGTAELLEGKGTPFHKQKSSSGRYNRGGQQVSTSSNFYFVGATGAVIAPRIASSLLLYDLSLLFLPVPISICYSLLFLWFYYYRILLSDK